MNPLRAAALFTAALVVFEGLALHLGYASYLLFPRPGSFPTREVVPAAALVLLGHAVTFLYVWSSLLAGRAARPVYFAGFAIAVLVQYGYYEAIRGFATPDDLITAVWGTSAEIRWGMAASYVGWRAAVPIGAYAVLLSVSPHRPDWRRACVFPLVLLALLANGLVLGLARPEFAHYRGYPTASAGGFLQSGLGVVWRVRHHAREAVTVAPPPPPPLNNIVFVVDESVRADHLSVNGYSRPTTPTLDQLSRGGALTNWGRAVSGSNCSAAANRLLWVGLPPALLPARAGEVESWPNIMQYAKAMGYRTTLIDNQTSLHWLGDTVELRGIDHWTPLDESADPVELDVQSARWIASRVDAGPGNFIWINKRGVHWPYPRAYPAEAVTWTPLPPGDRATWDRPDAIAPDLLINAYDNAIRYNVDGFFRELDLEHRRAGTIVVYTSDHGQSLAERGETWLHCSDRRSGAGSRHREVAVPLLMAVAGQQGSDVGAAYDRASHANVFPTLLDLMGVPPAARRHGYWPSLWPPERFQFRPRSYFLGESLEGTAPFWDVLRFDD